MKRYKKPKCTHAFILHLFPMIKSLPKVSILYPFSPLINFQIYTWDSLPFKPISHLTIICYHQNLIRRTLGLTNIFDGNYFASGYTMFNSMFTSSIHALCFKTFSLRIKYVNYMCFAFLQYLSFLEKKIAIKFLKEIFNSLTIELTTLSLEIRFYSHNPWFIASK